MHLYAVTSTPFDAVLPSLCPIAVPACLRGLVTKLLALDALAETYAALQRRRSGRPLLEELLAELEIDYRVADRDVELVPRKGPVILVSNHPYGLLDGAVLGTILKKVRPDVRFLANAVLGGLPEMADLLIKVDILSERNAVMMNSRSIRTCMQFVSSGGCLVVFPAGEVSHFQVRNFLVADGAWTTAVARMVAALRRSGVFASVVPVHVEGANSFLFHAAGLVHSHLRTILLGRELLNKTRAVVELRFGTPIEAQKLLEIPTNAERMQYLRWRSDLLANRVSYKPELKRPFLKARQSPGNRTPIADAADPEVCSAEIASLPAADLLVESGDLKAFLAPAARIPHVMREIARLREQTFRAVGEGTGKALDRDEFDDQYLHLFLWNAARKEIAGAYRLAQTDKVRDLYTSTLFKYGEAFLDKMGPALELGRSFIRPEYQKGFSPLLLLWKGIGRFIAQNRQYRILFGPVSISNEYKALSRSLMLKFLEKSAWLTEWAGFVSSRTPVKPSPNMDVELPDAFDVDDLSGAVSDVEQGRAGVPILLRQYLRLGGRLLGFNVDENFSNTVDGLIVVDLMKTDRKLLERYLGKGEAAHFVSYHESQQFGNMQSSRADYAGGHQRTPC